MEGRSSETILPKTWLKCHREKKDELVASVFAASEMGIPTTPIAEELVKKTELEKANLMV